MSIPFGSMNTTLAKTIAMNSPKYRRIIEPFGDNGTFALYLAKKKPKEHIVNIADEQLFAAFNFVQNMTPADKSRLKRLDWIASQETFDQVSNITVTEGFDLVLYSTKGYNN